MRLILTLVIVSASLRAQDAKDSINQGVAAFRQAHYQEAIAAFEQAARLEPDSATAHLYLGTAYMVQWVPGNRSPENDQNARAARAEFQRVLGLDATQTTALASLASMSYNEASALPVDQKSAKFDEARDLNQRIVQLNPADKNAYYYLGVIAWQKWYPAFAAARAQLGMAPETPGPLPDASVRQSLMNAYGAVLEEGISDLNEALKIDPRYEDAMAYMNLLGRERADLRDTKAEHDQDVAAADQWLQRALETRKAKARPQQ
jgi:tetratricopeptide (TPR) repeat protein